MTPQWATEATGGNHPGSRSVKNSGAQPWQLDKRNRGASPDQNAETPIKVARTKGAAEVAVEEGEVDIIFRFKHSSIHRRLYHHSW